jgi:CBS domain-containing protein
MATLSSTLRAGLIGPRQEKAKLVDLTIDPSAGDYPPVTSLFFRPTGGALSALPWEAVRLGSFEPGQPFQADLAAGAVVTNETLDKTVLLRRDVLDSLVLDLENCHAARANDLCLQPRGDSLLLRAVDVSPWAIVRRLGHGLFGAGVRVAHLVDWKNVEFLRGDPNLARVNGDYHRRIAKLKPAQIARLTDALPYLHAAELLSLLPEELAADVIELMMPERQVQVFEELEDRQGTRLLGLMGPDAAADLVGSLSPSIARRCLGKLPERQRARLMQLLQYPSDTAGGIMTNDLIVVSGHLTAGEARQALRQRRGEPDFVYNMYAVEEEERAGRLLGILSVRDLLMADDKQRIEDLLQTDFLALAPMEPADRAAEMVAENSLVAAPVLDEDGRLLGAVTIDAALAQLVPRSWRERPRVFS